MALGGTYRHIVAFAHNYVAEPLVKMHADATCFHVSMTIRNDKRSNMELLYLAHINFRPVDNGRLIYTAPCTPQNVRVRSTIPAHIKSPPEYHDFIKQIQKDPAIHEVLAPELVFDPEVVLFIDYLADEDGWAHSMQVHPDGSADYVRCRPEQLPKTTRWISRTPDQDAIAIVEAGTCEPEGYHTEKIKGNVKILKPAEHFYASLAVGVLAPDEVSRLTDKINQIRCRKSAN